MISKNIYYCWFGFGKKSKLIKKCIKSWRKYCPDYEILEINENNFDVNQNEFCAQAYKEKKYAYVADYARTKIIYEKGGIYLDCDVQLLKSLDPLLTHIAFIGVEHYDLIESYFFGAERSHRYIGLVLNTFDHEQFIKTDGGYNFHTMPQRFTECFKKMYAERAIVDQDYVFDDLMVYSTEYFQPIDYLTEKMNITDETYLIHHYSASWYSGWKKLLKNCSKIIPRPMRVWLRKILNKKRK